MKNILKTEINIEVKGSGTSRLRKSTVGDFIALMNAWKCEPFEIENILKAYSFETTKNLGANMMFRIEHALGSQERSIHIIDRRVLKMRNLIIILEQIEECLKGTLFLKEKEILIDNLKRGQSYQAPESTAYWEKTGETLIFELGEKAEANPCTEYINALAVWCAKTPLQIVDIMKLEGANISSVVQAQAMIDSNDWPYQVI